MKISKLSLILATFALALSASVALAQTTRVPAHNTKTPNPVNVKIPAHAVEVSNGVFALGEAIISDGRTVQGFVLLHHKTGHNGGPGGGGGGGEEPPTSKCFAFLAKDAEWKTTESYLINPANGDGLSDAFVEDTFAASVNAWDSEVAFDIFGAQNSTNAVLSADFSAPDENNEVYFASIEDEGVIAFTVVWGIFNGPPFNRELIEWDMVFDDDFTWGDANLDNTLMDFENIAAHELGHAAGMSHPDNTCTEETMYAFAAAGETKKRDLNTGDITGINELY